MGDNLDDLTVVEARRAQGHDIRVARAPRVFLPSSVPGWAPPEPGRKAFARLIRPRGPAEKSFTGGGAGGGS
jgi:hypothetical protein